MKAQLHYLSIALALLLLSTLNPQLSPVYAKGTDFTYQGRLNDAGSPANGNYDLQFIWFTMNPFGFPAAPIMTNAAVPMNNGLFTTTLDLAA